MTRTKVLTAAGLVAGLTGGAAAVAATRRTREPVPDPNEAHHYELPATTHTVVTDDGARLAVTDVGQGPAVALAHCWMGSRAVWAPVANRLLESGHRVVLYDQRGHGESTVGSDGFSIDRLGADLAAVLEARDVKDAVLAGHSMGGMTVMALLADHAPVAAERGRAMVLASTAAGGLAAAAARPGAAWAVSSPLTDRALRSRYGHVLQRGVFGSPACRNHLVAWRDLMVATPASARVGCLHAMRDMDLREVLDRAKWPVTVLVGSEDRLTSRRFAEEIASLLPDGQLEVVEGRGHMLPYEAADRLAEAIAKAAV